MIPAVLPIFALPTLQDVQGGSSDAAQYVEYALRWVHVWFGILWIGLLYFFNFVNGPTMAKLDGPTKKLLVPQLMPRALFWFRWGAAVTWLTGITLFTMIYMMQKNFWVGQSSANAIAGRGWWILLGVTFGTIMAFNVWFVIWPRQQKMIPATRDGQTLDPQVAKTAALASKINTYLSVPLVASMVSQHFSLMLANWTVTMPITVGLGFVLVWHWYKVAAKVQGM
jgi:uncharacterized membrane protein